MPRNAHLFCALLLMTIVKCGANELEDSGLSSLSPEQLEKLVNVTSKIITSTFKTYTCLYFYTNYCNTSGHVEEAVQNSLIPIVVLPRGNLKDYNDSLSCDGYLVVSDDYEGIKRTFVEYEKYKFHYKSNRKVLIFYNFFADFREEFYLNLTHLGGLDVVVCEDYQSGNLRTTSVRHNETLLSWSLDNSTDVDVKKFALIMTEWVPNFRILDKNYRFKASAFDCPPFIYYDKKTKQVIDGIEYRILESIRPKFPLEFIVHTDVNGTGLWTLNLLDVIGGMSNLAMCSQWQISILTQGMDVDMTFPYMQSCSTFLVPKPKLLPQSTYVFQPFQIQLWLFTYVLTQIIGLLLNLAVNFYKTVFEVAEFGAYSKLGVAAMHSIRIFTLGATYNPPSFLLVLRLVVLTSSLAALLLTTAYASGFTSSLTSPRFEKPINFITDMVDQLTYWGAKELDTFAVYNNTNDPHLRIVNRRFVLETETGVDRNSRILKDNYAFPINSLPNHYITETEPLTEYGKTHLKILSECVGLFHLVFALKANSPFTQLISRHISKCNEHGLTVHWCGDIQSFGGWSYMDNFFSTYVSSQNSSQRLSIGRIQGIFIFLALGHACSILIFGLEVLYSRYKRSISN